MTSEPDSATLATASALDSATLATASGALDPQTFFELFLADADGPRSWGAQGDRGRSVRNPVAEWRAWWQQAATADGVTKLAAESGFVLTTHELDRLGISRSQRRTAVRRGRWVQAGRGMVAPVDVQRDVPPHGAKEVVGRRRHAVVATAAQRARPTDAIGGRSAAILHGLPTLWVPQQPELLTVGDVGAGCRSPGHLYTAAVPDDETTTWYGRRVTTAARTLVDLGRHDRFDAIMAADAALREEVVTAGEVNLALETAIGWPGIRQARAVLALADPRAESPLESVTRLRILDEGLPVPMLQVWIGPYRVDFYWPERRVVLEADGRLKYTDEERWAEKKREQAIRRYRARVDRVERVTWSDVLSDWPATAQLLHEALA